MAVSMVKEAQIRARLVQLEDELARIPPSSTNPDHVIGKRMVQGYIRNYRNTLFRLRCERLRQGN